MYANTEWKKCIPTIAPAIVNPVYDRTNTGASGKSECMTNSNSVYLFKALVVEYLYV